MNICDTSALTADALSRFCSQLHHRDISSLGLPPTTSLPFDHLSQASPANLDFLQRLNSSHQFKPETSIPYSDYSLQSLQALSQISSSPIISQNLTYSNGDRKYPSSSSAVTITPLSRNNKCDQKSNTGSKGPKNAKHQLTGVGQEPYTTSAVVTSSCTAFNAWHHPNTSTVAGTQVTESYSPNVFTVASCHSLAAQTKQGANSASNKRKGKDRTSSPAKKKTNTAKECKKAEKKQKDNLPKKPTGTFSNNSTKRNIQQEETKTLLESDNVHPTSQVFHDQLDRHLALQKIHEDLENLKRLQSQIISHNTGWDRAATDHVITSSCSSSLTAATPTMINHTPAGSHPHSALLQWDANGQPLIIPPAAPPLPLSSPAPGLSVPSSPLLIPPLPSAAATTVSPPSHHSFSPVHHTSLQFLKREDNHHQKERHPSSPALSVVLSPSSTMKGSTTTTTTSFVSTTASMSNISAPTPSSTHLASPLSHWPLPPTPCTPSMPVTPTLPTHAPFWLSHMPSPSSLHQFSPTAVPGLGLDGGRSAASGTGALSYQFMTDAVSRQLLLVQQAAIQDPSSNLMWSYPALAPLLTQQMVVSDPRFTRTLHPALLPTLHPTAALHHPSAAPTIHTPVAASNTFHPLTGATIGNPQSTKLEDSPASLEQPPLSVASSKPSDDDPKLQVFLAPAVSGNVAAALSASATSLNPSLTPVIPPAGLGPSIPQNLTPTLAPQYLYPPSSLPFFCPKQSPLYPMPAFVQTPSTPILSINPTTTIAATTAPSNSIYSLNASGHPIPAPAVHSSAVVCTSSSSAASPASALGINLMNSMAHSTDAIGAVQASSLSLPTPPLVVLSPQLSSCTTEITYSNTQQDSRTEPNVSIYPVPHGPTKANITPPTASSPGCPKKVSRAPYKSDVKAKKDASHVSLNIKREIKLENLSPQSVNTSTEREEDYGEAEEGCVDLSVSSSQKLLKNKEIKRIKKESGVPDSDKKILNQKKLGVCNNVGNVYVDNQSYNQTCLSSTVPETFTKDVPSKFPVASTPENHYTTHFIDDSNKYACASTSLNHSSILGPVQDRALDLSGLQLLSESVLKHEVGFTPSTSRNTKQTNVPRPSRDYGTSPHMVWSSSPFVISSSDNSVITAESSSSEGPLCLSTNSNFASKKSGRISSSKSSDVSGKSIVRSSSTPSVIQPSKYQNNFSLLCALATHELQLDGQKKTDSRSTASGNETTNTLPQSNKIKYDCEKSSTTHQPQQYAPCIGATSSPHSIPVGDSTFDDYPNSPSPLDLTLTSTKRTSPVHAITSPVPTVSTITQTEEPSFPAETENAIETSELEKTFSKSFFTPSYESSSSDSQTFEGFETTPMKRIETHVRRQIVPEKHYIHERTRLPKKRIVRNKRETCRPCKRKRCFSETSNKTCCERHLKMSHYECHNEVITSKLEQTNELNGSFSEEKVPKLTISGLKTQGIGGEFKVSPRLQFRSSAFHSSSEEDYTSDEEGEADYSGAGSTHLMPRRRWSSSGRTSLEKCVASKRPSRKQHHLSVIASKGFTSKDTLDNISDGDLYKVGNLSDASSRAIHTETSVESSDHENTSLSSSKKRKPGRPRKHSPMKKDATETIVAKKHKNINFVMPSLSVMNTTAGSSKSKLKPKLKAEVREIQQQYEDEVYQLPSDTDEEIGTHGKPLIQSGVGSASPQRDIGGGGSEVCKSSSMKRNNKRSSSSTLTKKAIMRDKQKRKCDAQQQDEMEALFRTLKRRSILGNAEHDESDENDSDQSSCVDISLTPTEATAGDHLNPCSAAAPPAGSSSTAVALPAAVKQEPLDIECVVKTEPPNTTTGTVVDASDCCPSSSVNQEQVASLSSNAAPDPPSVCTLSETDLVKGSRVLFRGDDGLLYAATVNPITPPDLYSVLRDGERSTNAQIYCAEQMLSQAWKEVKPGSTRFLKEGTRVCCFWSQQYRALYSGTVGSSSPTHSNDSSTQHNYVTVEFDDGDTGRIHVDDIRLLPQDYPVIDQSPNPILTIGSRKRRQPNRDSVDSKASACSSTQEPPSKKPKKNKIKKKSSKKSRRESMEDIDHEVGTEVDFVTNTSSEHVNHAGTPGNSWADGSSNISDSHTKPYYSVVVPSYSSDGNVLSTSSSSATIVSGALHEEDSEVKEKTKKKKKKHIKSDNGEHHHKKHKHKHKRSKSRHDEEQQQESTGDSGAPSQVFPHIEKMDGDLRVRIKSPPPVKPCSPYPSHDTSGGSSPRTVVLSSSDAGPPTPSVSQHTSTYTSMVSAVGGASHEPSSSSVEGGVETDRDNNSRKCRNKSSSRKDSNRPQRSVSRTGSVTYEERSDDDDSDTQAAQGKATKKLRRSSGSKSTIAAFLPARDLWQWSGKGVKKKGKGKRVFYKEIVRQNERIRVGDCCVFRSSSDPDNPFIGCIRQLFESRGQGRVSVDWFYHPNEIPPHLLNKKLKQPKGALFSSNHSDSNDLQTISYKCEVLSFTEYKARCASLLRSSSDTQSTYGTSTAAPPNVNLSESNEAEHQPHAVSTTHDNNNERPIDTSEQHEHQQHKQHPNCDSDEPVVVAGDDVVLFTDDSQNNSEDEEENFYYKAGHFDALHPIPNIKMEPGVE